MQILPVYLVLTTCILFVKSFDNSYIKIFDEIKKENLRHSPKGDGDEIHEKTVGVESSMQDIIEKKVMSDKVGVKWTKFKNKELLGKSALLQYQNVNVYRNEHSPVIKILTNVTKMKPAPSDLNSLQDTVAASVKSAKNESQERVIIATDNNTINVTTLPWVISSNDLKKEAKGHLEVFLDDSTTEVKPTTVKPKTQNIKDIRQREHRPKIAKSKKIAIPIDKNINLILQVSSSNFQIFLESRNETSISRGLMDSLKPSKGLSPMLPYMLAPALTMAGLLPWMIPGIRMAAGLVQMINQMAFMSGLFTLIRGYIFTPNPDEHVVYVNHGYNKKYHYGQGYNNI